MLQVVSNTHDSHHSAAERNSAAALAAAQGDGKLHLLLACSGSVATIKLPDMIRALGSRHGERLSMRVVVTEAAAHFLAGQSPEQPTLAAVAALPGVDAVYRDSDEWGRAPPWRRGMPILHIELRRWAHLLVVAPLSVNTLAKVAGGLCDNLLTSVVRAWDASPSSSLSLPPAAPSAPRPLDGNSDAGDAGMVDRQGEDGQQDGQQDGRAEQVPKPGLRRKRIVVAPAANTAMWQHPVTERHLRVLEGEWGGEQGWFDVLRPQEKLLACGDTGIGAMRDWKEIVEFIEIRLGLQA